jgi:choline-glycine betaine transporter
VGVAQGAKLMSDYQVYSLMLMFGLVLSVGYLASTLNEFRKNYVYWQNDAAEARKEAAYWRTKGRG